MGQHDGEKNHKYNERWRVDEPSRYIRGEARVMANIIGEGGCGLGEWFAELVLSHKALAGKRIADLHQDRNELGAVVVVPKIIISPMVASHTVN